MAEIKRLGVLSLATFVAVICPVLAAIFGLPLLLLEVAIPGGGIVAYGLAIVLALVGGGVAGAVIAVVYNGVARVVGGLTIELAME